MPGQHRNAAEYVHEQEHQDHRDAGDEQREGRVAPQPAQASPEHREGVGKVQTLLATTIVALVALAIGFRPTTGPVEWLGAACLLALAAVAVSVLCVALGLAANSVETASNSPMFLTLLPFLGSGSVPASTMPGPLRWFAENQPFTPLNEALRGLLLGTPIGGAGLLAVAWCVGVAGVGLVWARRLYDRLPVRVGA